MAEAAGSSATTDGLASPDSTDSLEYECKICYNYFDLERRSPKVLSCSHTFCQQCLETLHLREGRGWRLGCPVCRRRTPVPEYRVRNLSNNAALIEALPLREERDSSSTRAETGASASGSASSATPRDTTTTTTTTIVEEEEDEEGCETCKHVAFAMSCVCAIFSFLAMVVLLFLGLIFVHNFNHVASPVGPVCLFTASVLALFSLILTWLICMLKYRPDAEPSTLSSLTSNVM